MDGYYMLKYITMYYSNAIMYIRVERFYDLLFSYSNSENFVPTQEK